jgi:6-pyruvoyltetrahydropterin/6-carboxytetrahydropterin synthase
LNLTVTRRYRFAASHRLHVASLSSDENKQLYGKCNNPYGHGHDYVLDITVEGALDEVTGKLLPLAQLDKLVHSAVIRRFDRRNLNLDLPEFSRLVPTTENICLMIADLLNTRWSLAMPPRTRLARIYIEETARNSFEVLLPVTKPDEAPPAEAVERTTVHV